MARIHGRRGRLYVELSPPGSAEPISFLNSWSISAEVDRVDVTAFGDSNKVELAGLPASSGDFGGFYDSETDQLYGAALDGVPRKFYLYPNTNNNTQYFWGTANFDFSISASVDGAVEVSGSWSATGPVQKNQGT